MFILSGWYTSYKLVCKTISHPRPPGKQAPSLDQGPVRGKDTGTKLHLSSPLSM